MSQEIDSFDRRILKALQSDATLSVEAVSERVGMSRNACWRRMKRLEADGFIRERVTVLDPDKLGLGLTAFVAVRTNNHDRQWLQQFRDAVRLFPEIIGAHRMTGDLDYVLRVVVADMKAYDAFYQRLVEKVPLSDVSASFVMEDIINTSRLPL